MDRTQDSGSWNVGSTPTWRIFLFHKLFAVSVDKSTFSLIQDFYQNIIYKKEENTSGFTAEIFSSFIFYD